MLTQNESKLGLYILLCFQWANGLTLKNVFSVFIFSAAKVVAKSVNVSEGFCDNKIIEASSVNLCYRLLKMIMR